MLRIIVLLTLLLSCASVVMAADPAAQLAERLAPRPATVLSERNGEVLIDAGSNAGVVPFDLFAVPGPGVPVLHPQTGALLGETSESKAVLQVSWVKENFSGARRVRGAATPLAAGDKAVRFGELKAEFIGCSGDAEALFADLRRQLPTLRWGSYRKTSECARIDAAGADLVFVATATELVVRDASGNLLASVARATAAPTAVATTGATGSERWYGGDWQGEPVALASGDIDGDKQIELVVASPRRLRLGRVVNRNWQEVASLELPVTHRVLALELFDVDGDGDVELCVSAARDNELSSFLFAWRDGRLVEVQKGLPYILRPLTFEASSRALYGQELESGRWDGQVRRLYWDGQRLQVGEKLALPNGTGLRGLIPISADGVTMQLRLGWNDSLEILDATGESVWQSDTPYGGSETFIEVAGDSAQGRLHNTRNLYVQQRLQALAPDQAIVPINYGSRNFNRQISFEESQVQVLRWDGRALRVVRETPKEKGYLADCIWADVDADGQPELAMLIAYAKAGLFNKGRYSLVVLEL